MTSGAVTTPTAATNPTVAITRSGPDLGPARHLTCRECGATWEVGEARAAAVSAALRRDDGFEVDIGHVTLVGRCADCVAHSAC